MFPIILACSSHTSLGLNNHCGRQSRISLAWLSLFKHFGPCLGGLVTWAPRICSLGKQVLLFLLFWLFSSDSLWWHPTAVNTLCQGHHQKLPPGHFCWVPTWGPCAGWQWLSQGGRAWQSAVPPPTITSVWTPPIPGAHWRSTSWVFFFFFSSFIKKYTFSVKLWVKFSAPGQRVFWMAPTGFWSFTIPLQMLLSRSQWPPVVAAQSYLIWPAVGPFSSLKPFLHWAPGIPYSPCPPLASLAVLSPSPLLVPDHLSTSSHWLGSGVRLSAVLFSSLPIPTPLFLCWSHPVSWF